MRLNFIGRVSRIAAAFGAILLGSASCVNIDETLGGNFIPTDQTWNVFPCEPVAFDKEGITLKNSDYLSGYSTSRFTFGSIQSGDFRSDKGTSFTLVPLADSLDFGDEGTTEVIQFHLTAVRDTLSMVYDKDERILQNVYVYSLNAPLDSTVLYTSTDLKKDFVDIGGGRITKGVPVYNGGDSLSFDFSTEYAEAVIDGIKDFQKMTAQQKDSLSNYLKHVPGIYMETDPMTADGGRINMFNLPIEASDGYIDGNYAELKIRAKYNGRETDTLFVFYFGPSEFLKEEATSYPAQFAFNTSHANDALAGWEAGTKENLYIEGGSGLKPVVKASEIRSIAKELIEAQGDKINPAEVVINKATIILPYNVDGAYEKLDKYPMILSPTVKLVSEDEKYISYAGLTDSSIESENQGDINRSLNMYCPDISHHVQEIVKLEQKEGESDEEFRKRLDKYDIWFLIMHEETVTSSSVDANNSS